LEGSRDSNPQLTSTGKTCNQLHYVSKIEVEVYKLYIPHTPSKFIEANWVRLAKLPTYGGINVTIPKLFTSDLTTLEYGTVIYDSQEVVDFLVGYGAWLKTEGWVFDEVSSETNELEDWVKAAKDFIISWINVGFKCDISISNPINYVFIWIKHL